MVLLLVFILKFKHGFYALIISLIMLNISWCAYLRILKNNRCNRWHCHSTRFKWNNRVASPPWWIRLRAASLNVWHEILRAEAKGSQNCLLNKNGWIYFRGFWRHFYVFICECQILCLGDLLDILYRKNWKP